MFLSLLRSRNQRVSNLHFLSTQFKDNIITNPESIKAGASPFKMALAEMIILQARYVATKEYRCINGWNCLQDPLPNWENNHFIYLSTLLDVSTSTLKRVFEYKSYEAQTQNISPAVKQKLCDFLQTDNLEQSVMNHILQKKDFAK
jgi:hypothetical protein